MTLQPPSAPLTRGRVRACVLASQMELGITGGEEDGVNNEDVNPEDLYSKPEEIWEVVKELSSVSAPARSRV